MRLTVALGAALALLIAAPAHAAPDLTLSASHARATFLRSQAPNTTLNWGTLTLTVENAGADPTDGSVVTVTETLPAGLTALVNNPGVGAGPTAASGAGWTCTGTTISRCTRGDVLTPGEKYPPIVVTVGVANTAGALLRNAPTVAGGGDAAGGAAADDIPVVADACPNGWSREARVAFGAGADSGVLNPERPDGCSLLDLVWAAEPFADHAAFVAKVAEVSGAFAELTAQQREAIAAAAAASTVGSAPEPDNSCNSRVALTFDDGPSYYRPATLAHLRAKGVPATLFDLGMRLEANPQLVRWQLDEGHTVLAHSFDHPNLNNIPSSVLAFQVTGTAARFDALGAPYTFKVLRPPFLSVNATTAAAVAAMGYAVTPNPISAADWEPARSAAQIRDGIVNALRPGVAILLHDGPVDSPAGQATVDAVPQIIDAARARGYCFGTIDRSGHVVANRHVPSGRPIPEITGPVPYLPLASPGALPAPATTVAQPLQIEAAHSPAVFVRGETGALTLSVSNPTDGATDGSTTTVTHPIPAGLTSLGASGTGWTCAGTNTVTCTRADVLAPGASFPPITINVRVATTANAVLTTAPRVTGRSGNVWVDSTTDRISTAVPVAGDVGGTVPATLALTLGSSAGFGAFTPGVAREYGTSLIATVTSSAADALLSVADPDPVATGHLVNGALALAQPLRVAANGAAPATVGGSAAPTPLLSYAGPTANDAVTVAFTQPIAATDALRTGSYAKTLVFTLSTTTP
jgi:peptidoglycan/xylan/chitin deacetylase (PgdA/CDA1 family)